MCYKFCYLNSSLDLFLRIFVPNLSWVACTFFLVHSIFCDDQLPSNSTSCRSRSQQQNLGLANIVSWIYVVNRAHHIYRVSQKCRCFSYLLPMSIASTTARLSGILSSSFTSFLKRQPLQHSQTPCQEEAYYSANPLLLTLIRNYLASEALLVFANSPRPTSRPTSRPLQSVRVSIESTGSHRCHFHLSLVFPNVVGQLLSTTPFIWENDWHLQKTHCFQSHIV